MYCFELIMCFIAKKLAELLEKITPRSMGNRWKTKKRRLARWISAEPAVYPTGVCLAAATNHARVLVLLLSSA